jgi:hypothetical protein
VILFSCAEKAVSIDDRIADFITSLGGDRTDTYTNFDPSTAAYSTAKSPTFWDTSVFGVDKPYTYGTPNTSDPADVEFHIFDHGGTDLANFQFIMVNIGTTSDNWVISNIKVTPPGAFMF